MNSFTFEAVNQTYPEIPVGQVIPICVCRDSESNYYADCAELGMGHKFPASKYSPKQVASELARRHGFKIVEQTVNPDRVEAKKTCLAYQKAGIESKLCRLTFSGKYFALAEGSSVKDGKRYEVIRVFPVIKKSKSVQRLERIRDAADRLLADASAGGDRQYEFELWVDNGELADICWKLDELIDHVDARNESRRIEHPEDMHCNRFNPYWNTDD